MYRKNVVKSGSGQKEMGERYERQSFEGVGAV
jgi:hypothetical protein